eukprot:scaffold2.g7475.t1
MPLCHSNGSNASPFDLLPVRSTQPTAQTAGLDLLGLGLGAGLSGSGLQEPQPSLLDSFPAAGGAGASLGGAAALLGPLEPQLAVLQAQQLAAQAAAAEQLLPLLNLSNLLAAQGLSVHEVADLLALKQALQQQAAVAAAAPAAPAGGAGGGRMHGTGPLLNPLYKASPGLRYGAKCQFAHGREEMRPVQRHPKYKTEVCRTFAATGICPYGMRCRFIHSAGGTAAPKVGCAAAAGPAAPAASSALDSVLGQAGFSTPPPTPPAPARFPSPPPASAALALAGLLPPTSAGAPAGLTATASLAAALLAPAAAPPTISPRAAPFVPSGLAPIGTHAPSLGLGGSLGGGLGGGLGGSLGTPGGSALSLPALGSAPGTPSGEAVRDGAVRRSLSETGMAAPTTPGGSSRRLPIFSKLVDEQGAGGAGAGPEAPAARPAPAPVAGLE